MLHLLLFFSWMHFEQTEGGSMLRSCRHTALCTGSVGTITLRVNLRLLTLMRDTLIFQDYHGQELRLIEHFQRPFVGSLNSMTLTLDSTRARYHIRSSTAPHHTTCFALNIASSGH
ncbi:hypothetical protein KC19_4G082900 [Ceratodon purpureus]|uniref:Secreted protein n=1 Tax=Ceratodon purpureus TaxID=3225 RepID=A0A8T0I6C1_CERPU|nr:hypothetical protein KC19_4G082900 [Ceratodon purpureus]